VRCATSPKRPRKAGNPEIELAKITAELAAKMALLDAHLKTAGET
jgi:hypothetical protein